MIRWLIGGALAAVIGISMALAPVEKRAKDEHVRALAREEACRAIVEAGLVRSCTVNSLHSKQK